MTKAEFENQTRTLRVKKLYLGALAGAKNAREWFDRAQLVLNQEYDLQRFQAQLVEAPEERAEAIKSYQAKVEAEIPESRKALEEIEEVLKEQLAAVEASL